MLGLQLRLLHWNLWRQSPHATSSCGLISTQEREGGREGGEREREREKEKEKEREGGERGGTDSCNLERE